MKVKADINIPLISLDYIYFLFNCILLTLRPHTDLNMKQQYIALILFLLSLFVAHSASAQIKGVVTDSLTNEPLMYITVQYEGKGVGAITNAEGEYTVETRKGWNELSFSAIGYVTKKVTLKPTTKVLNVKLAPADVMLSEVVVKPQKEKYSRKNNPAVDFMRKVIENKKELKLEANDFYQYQKYEKMKMSMNDVTPEKMEKGIYKKFSFFKDQVEVSPKTNKMILPISIKETSSKTIYRKSPKSEKTIIEGVNSSGIEEFFNTGDMLGTILTDVFSDVNIYDDDIRLLQRRFVSPIGRGAISFYKYYLMDTVMVDDAMAIREELEAIAADMVNPTEVRVLKGTSPADLIVNCAKEEGCDLIITGSRGQGGVKGFLGSVSYAVTKESPMTVLIAKEGDCR